jgi:hypothetical protein
MYNASQLISAGNMGTDSGGECAVPMYYRFASPSSSGNGIFWFASCMMDYPF